MAEDIDDELREAICNSIPYVNNQVVQAAIDGDFSNSPQWIWRNHENGVVGFGRWPHHPDAAPYIRADLIVAVLVRAATSHALGFKAGIEAGVEVAMSAINVGNGEAKSGMARAIARQISSLPTPPSMLPEILEAMRPVAKHVAEVDESEHATMHEAKATIMALEPLRAIAAMFTKLGGKI